MKIEWPTLPHLTNNSRYPAPPPWWPNGRERWWHELGEGVEAPPYKPARAKVVAVVAMVKNIAPDYERLAMAMQMASSVTSIITDAEAMAWDAGVTRERDAYIARHPRSAPPTSGPGRGRSCGPSSRRR
uniref:Ethylene insensitive 3-like DNA-binding domain-containing protein n=1 Tax=Oryza brachyantha TaxID=4533 RepID=J3MJY0_ORYBR